MTKPRYLSKVTSRSTLADPANPRRKFIPFGKVTRANHPPRANRAREDSTNGKEYLRSRFVRPGTMNIHSSYSTTGRAMGRPRNATTLIFTRKGWSGLENTSLHGLLGSTAKARWTRRK